MYEICVKFTTRLYNKALGLILCDLIWQIRHNYNRFDDGHCDDTGHRKMSVLGTAGAMLTTHYNSVIMWSFKDQIVLRSVKPIGNENGDVYKLNSISNLSRISDWSVHSGSYFVLCGEYRQPIAQVGGA